MGLNERAYAWGWNCEIGIKWNSFQCAGVMCYSSQYSGNEILWTLLWSYHEVITPTLGGGEVFVNILKDM